MTPDTATTLDEHVRQHREELVKVIRHGNDDFVRGLALAAIVEYGESPDLERIRRDIERAEQLEGSA